MTASSSALSISPTISTTHHVLHDKLSLNDKDQKDSPRPIASSSIVASDAVSENNVNYVLWNNDKEFLSDRVVRVLEDDVVIKLEKSGLVSLAGLQFPKNLYNSDCTSYSFTTPSTKLKQLLPPQTAVRVLVAERGGDGKSRRPRKAIVLVNITPKQQQQKQTDAREATSIQEELLRRGYAKVRFTTSVDDDSSSFPSHALMDHWTAVQEQAQLNKVGPLYHQESCMGGESPSQFALDTQFEPISLTMRTDWSDGPSTTTKPKNPGDTVGCSDFDTYEDALRWYERYFPWYGDVAKLDRNGDGVPCPGLAHTKDPERYRVKIPNNQNRN